MQLYCKNAEAGRGRGPQSCGLTLIEIVVVLAILVALSGLIVPLISGLGHQTNASANATLIADVNRAIGTFFARPSERNQYPDQWDSLLNTSGGLFDQLHPALNGSNPDVFGPALLEPVDLSQPQAESLHAAGIFTLYPADESSTVAPSLNEATAIAVTTGAKAALLKKVVDPSPFDKLNFNSDIANDAHVHIETDNEFVVFGVGFNTSMRGATLLDVPTVQSADPTNYYARMLCVFMLPKSDATSTFPAKYVGCFLPDGTSLRNNLDKYHNSAASN